MVTLAANGKPDKTVTSTSGVVRSDPDGKPDYTTIDPDFLERLAVHMTANIPSKGYNNWRNASTDDDLLRFRRSAWRHLIAWERGETDEDHAAALVFNVMGAEYVRRTATGTDGRAAR